MDFSIFWSNLYFTLYLTHDIERHILKRERFGDTFRMTILTCPLPSCGFQTDDIDVVGAAAILNVHSHYHMNAPTPAAPVTRAPRFERPRIQPNSTSEDWNAFIRRWDTFRLGTGITDAAAPGQFMECASEQLGNVVLRAHPTFTVQPLAEALATLKSIAVIPIALGVLQSNLAAMRQDPDESRSSR